MGSHDTLFKHVFSDPENAAAQLRAVLPARIARAVDWSTLRLEPGSFVDAELAERHTDLLFSASISGRRAYLYFLFEHQSGPDPWMPLRIAGYTLRIWEEVRRREPARQRLPVVIPIVLHHGPGGWTPARSIAALLDADRTLLAALGDRTLALRILVDDLARIEPARIAARSTLAVVALALGILRDTRSLSLDELIARWSGPLSEVARRPGVEALRVFVRYVSEVRKIERRGEWIDVIRRHVGRDVEEVVVTLFDNLRAEGRAEGEAKGRAEGRAEVVLKQLALKFGALDEATSASVRAASIEELDRIAERVLTATSLDEALGVSGQL
jgi:predicted transposase/invertase (TIGR01784 family)